MPPPRNKSTAVAEQGPPQTLQQWLDEARFLLSRVPGIYATVFTRFVALPVFPAFWTNGQEIGPRLVVPVTDHPETTHFHVRVQMISNDGNFSPARRARYIINLEGVTRREQIGPIVANNGNELVPNGVADEPVARARRTPITIDLVGVRAESQVVVQVFEMRRIQNFPT